MSSIEKFAQIIRDYSDGALTNVSTFIIMAMVVVVGLMAIMSVLSLFTSVWLAVKYVKYNRRQNSLGRTGQEIAREVLDQNGLGDIRVSASGSILFGNSYSHFFRKVRLRRLTWKKASISSMAMATQKASLAILDKEGDRDMKARITMTPIIYFGPLAFVPLVIIGVLLDWLVLQSSNGTFTIILLAIGLGFYLLAFIMSLMVLKTERKAQARALEIMRKDGIATEEEIEMCKKLYHLYNIEYVNDMIVALLEMLYRILQFVAYFRNSSSSSKK